MNQRCKRWESRHALQTRDSRTHQTRCYRANARQPCPHVPWLPTLIYAPYVYYNQTRHQKLFPLREYADSVGNAFLPIPRSSKHRSTKHRDQKHRDQMLRHLPKTTRAKTLRVRICGIKPYDTFRHPLTILPKPEICVHLRPDPRQSARTPSFLFLFTLPLRAPPYTPPIPRSSKH